MLSKIIFSPIENSLGEMFDAVSRGKRMLDLLGNNGKMDTKEIRDLIWKNYESNQKVINILKHFDEHWIHISLKKKGDVGLVVAEISLPPLR